jgi:hypothetical protein
MVSQVVHRECFVFRRLPFEIICPCQAVTIVVTVLIVRTSIAVVKPLFPRLLEPLFFLKRKIEDVN